MTLSFRDYPVRIRQALTYRLNLRRWRLKKTLPLLILIITAGISIWWILGVLRRVTAKKTISRTNISADGRVVIAGPTASQQLNQEFLFPLNDSKGKTVTEVKFLLELAELRNEIIVKGQRATSVEGRSFLILTIKITSTFARALEINAKDYFRLTVNDNTAELLAPEIHNDPVIIQPTSTKYTRLGFPINDSDKNLKLMIGEIEGEKSTVDLNLQ